MYSLWHSLNSKIYYSLTLPSNSCSCSLTGWHSSCFSFLPHTQCWWTEHICIYTFVNQCFHFYGKDVQKWDNWKKGNVHFYTFLVRAGLLSKWLSKLTFLPAVNECQFNWMSSQFNDNIISQVSHQCWVLSLFLIFSVWQRKNVEIIFIPFGDFCKKGRISQSHKGKGWKT